MKKLFVALLVLSLLASVSFAAKALVARPVTSSSSGMRIGIGSYIVGPGQILGGAGYTLLKFYGETFTGGVGLSYQSLSANNATNSTFGIMGQLAFNLTGGTVPTHIGGSLIYNSVPGGSNFTVGLLYGMETAVAGNLMFGIDLIPLVFFSQNVNNASLTCFALGSAALYGSYLF